MSSCFTQYPGICNLIYFDSSFPPLQLMDLNLILPGGAIVADNTLMKVCRSRSPGCLTWRLDMTAAAHSLLCPSLNDVLAKAADAWDLSMHAGQDVCAGGGA